MQTGKSIQMPKSVQEMSARQGEEAVAVFWPCFPLGGKNLSAPKRHRTPTLSSGD